jgi:hypothetical protein
MILSRDNGQREGAKKIQIDRWRWNNEEKTTHRKDRHIRGKIANSHRLGWSQNPIGL